MTAMDDTQEQVGRRRTSDGPTQVTQDGQMPSRWIETVGEDEAVLQPDRRAGRLASDSQSLFQHARSSNLNGRANALAGRLAGKLGKIQKYAWPTEDLVKLALAACASDSRTFEMAIDATRGGRKILSSRTTAGKGRLLRKQIADKQPRNRARKPAKLRLPDVCVEEASTQHPELRNIGTQRCIMKREAANFLAEMHHEAAAHGWS